MNNCCNKCLKVCEPLGVCPNSFAIKLPLNYGEEDVIIQITKTGVETTISQLLPVYYPGGLEEFGKSWANIDLELVPESFFNPWGGIYMIKFFSAETGKQWQFSGCDEIKYDSICMEFSNNHANFSDDAFELNVFIDCEDV